ncbi:uncharacterized protein LOC133792285 [Humulus lupulus]|uniref:uncharacterized protein LOC133792285 n=1 Tax=Humulus lupulus TaxID=3486 RepID=UPI002B400F37|nr:uncharacterized protein LOC133792285 [Humulus lupulus]
MEVAYNNSYHKSIKMVSYEALYGRKCRSPIHWHEAGERRFLVGDKVLLKVALLKGALCFGKKGKLSPRYIRPFEIVEKIGMVAYRLALPPALARVHDVFHVPILRKYVEDLSHVLSYGQLEVDPKLCYEEKPERILDHKDKVMCNKNIPMVKVQWCNHGVEEATWEPEDWMRELYP